MAITYEVRQDLLTAIVGMFDGAPTLDLLTSLVERIEDGATVAELADELGETEELATIYPTYLTAEEFAESFVGNLLGDNVDADTLALGEEFVAGLINGGSSRGEAMYTAIQALASVSEDDATWGQAATQLNNKVDVATTFALTTDFSGLSLEELRSVTADVDASEDSVTDKKALIQAGILDADAQTQRLTTGQDFLEGTSLSDFFKATYFDNQNTLQSGDEIDGGAGTDTLYAKIGNSADFAINVETSSVEVAKFQAQSTVTDNSDNEVASDLVAGDSNAYAQVDAQDMDGTVEFWSVNSRADLVIEDVRNDSDETTIVMQDTDAGDVDYAVYFDTQHITAPDGTTAGSSLYLEILDLQGMADGTGPLTNNPYKGVVITVDGVEVELVADEAINAENLGAEPTYQDIVDALNAALEAAGYTTITASLGDQFSKYSSDDGELYSGTTIVLTNSGSEELGSVGWVADGAVPAETNVHTNITNEDPAVTTYLTQTDIELDNVGRGSESGDLRAGNMSTGDSGSAGIQQFNVTVHDSSWITSLSTTNDDLEEVYVVNSTELLDEGTNGDLTIGDNGHDDGYNGLENVRVFDASAMTGDVDLEAALEDAVIAKYFDKEDTANDYETDNIQFEYSTGSGDDTVMLTVSEEAVSYEDFELTIDTGAGNDEVIFEVEGTATDSLDANWNEDQEDLDNIVISTGAGNDTVRALGDGEVTITTGAGNDVVYSDNSGLDSQAATWLFNAENTDIDDLEGSDNSESFFLYNATVTVTFSAGAAAAGVSSGTAAEDDNGFESSSVSIDVSDYVADMADINQALKEAINNDATLSQWLVATDGPNDSVIVTALVDGVYDADDLLVTIDQAALPTNPSTAYTTVQAAWEAYNENSAIADILDTDLDTQLANIKASSTNSGYSTVNAAGTTTGTSVQATQGDAVNEVQTLNFAGVTADDTATYTVTIGSDVFTYTAAAGDGATAAGVASAVAAVIDLDANYTASASGTVVTIEAVAANAGTNLATAQVVGNNVDAGGVDEAALAALVDVDTTTDGLAAGATLVGVASDEEANNNTINLGSGNDVLALSTNDDSAETIVFTGTDIGNNDILNFALAEDTLDFTAYLENLSSASGSTASQQTIATSILDSGNDTDAEAANIDLTANLVVVVNDFADGGSTTETWANLTAASLKAALNDDGTGTDDYANISTATHTEATDLVGSTQDSIIMIENDDNDGEYKVFEVTSTVGTTDTVSTVTLLGTVDFGESIDNTTVVA
ncbi:beta strand repeat-containing protein [Marinomonas ostreistagni]|uniref:Uncharacterized protein n=1 Tax=Marinomonas ostreistagni TaxID=359209 RepID=A0ABS0ZCW4_9GAMM|nr:hypothetical protein [Marinomonas ostreistagni]MBJ7551501.1 hypothetical protein [Marinomonas ostreistagni]